MTQAHLRASRQVMTTALKASVEPALVRRKPPPGEGDWLAGMAISHAGVRRYRLYRPPGIQLFERLPLLVMLHGCGQDAKGFALATRIHRLAARERFFVLFVEQDRSANLHGCWNWYDTRSGRAYGEVGLVMAAIDQVTLLYPIDPTRIAVAGLSAGASMAALLASRHPARFKAVVMHSGVPPGAAHSSATAFGAMRGSRRPEALPVAERHWPALLVIHGKADSVVSSKNAHAAARTWAEAAGARPGTARVVQRGKRHAMSITDYKLGDRTVSTLCEIDTLGHAWSGGAARQPYSDARGPDASRLLWSFVLKQFRVRAAG